jgi:flagellar capping protein FliD
VFGSLSKLATSYTQAGGLLSGATTRLTAQVSGLVSRMDRMSAQLDIRRQSLQREYIAADMAMSQMKSAGSSLSSIGSEYRLF